jgi:hypothetical protein
MSLGAMTPDSSPVGTGAGIPWRWQPRAAARGSAMRSRWVTRVVVGLLALGGGSVASSAAPPRAVAQVGGTSLVPPFTLDAGGETKVTSSTVTEGARYILAVSGTATEQPSIAGVTQYDAIYCFSGCYTRPQTPSFDERTLGVAYIGPDDKPILTGGYAGFVAFDPRANSNVPPYSGTHVDRWW